MVRMYFLVWTHYKGKLCLGAGRSASGREIDRESEKEGKWKEKGHEACAIERAS